jgi:1-acyl-sn-glycerol-3-phosphate acyltransferase
MAYLRAVAVFVVLMFFYVAVAPLQWLALRRRWPLSLRIPGLFHRCLLAILHIEVKTHNWSGPEAPKLVVANHVSWTDICTLSTFAPVCFLSKKEVGTWPIISTFARLQRTVFVDREQAKSIVGANATMVDRMDEKIGVVLFPEGTTFDGSALGHFHSSHFAAPRDFLRRHAEVETFFVQPVAICYSHKHVAWYGDAALLPHLLELLKGPPVRCDLYFCDPIPMTRGADRKTIADTCNKSIEAMLMSARLPATEF